MMLLVAAVLACAVPQSAAVPDPSASVAYVAVAREEWARGEDETALVAVRKALSLDASNAEARALFDEWCARGGTEEEAFDRALQQLDADDAAGALESLARARKSGETGAEGSLVEGVALYRLARWDEARAALERAATDPALAAQSSLYLGLVAWATGDRTEAEARLSTLTGGADPRLWQLSQDLLRASKRDGRLMVRAGVDARYDSNVGLLPDGSAPRDRTGDLAGVGSAGLYGRPMESLRWLSLGVGGLFRAQVQRPEENFGGVSATVRAESSGLVLQGALEGAWETDWLGGVPYLHAPRATAALRWRPRGPWSLKGSWRSRVERFLDETFADYSGVRHTATLEAGAQWDRLGAWLSWRGERNATRADTNDFLETGPALQLVAVLPWSLRAGLFGALGWREFWLRDRAEHRDDDLQQAELWIDRDLGESVSVRASLGVNRLGSTTADVGYTNAYGTIGLQFQRGWL